MSQERARIFQQRQLVRLVVRKDMTNNYEKLYRRSLDDPEGFWAEAAEDVHWYKKPDKKTRDSHLFTVTEKGDCP